MKVMKNAEYPLSDTKFKDLKPGQVFTQGMMVGVNPCFYMKVGTGSMRYPKCTNAVTFVTGKKVNIDEYKSVVLWPDALMIPNEPNK